MQKTRENETVYPINSVGKALALLQLIPTHDRLRVTDVSRELGIAPSTAHRLLTMFERAGLLVQRDRHSVYTIGPELVGLATLISGHLDIETLARPHLVDLVRELNETVHVCVLRGSHVLFVDCVESTHTLRAVSRKGRSIPAYATAGGKALLAELSPADLDRVFPDEALPQLTRKTLGSRAALNRELRRVIERGYATNAEESELDFAACAAVVRDVSGRARASIVVAGPASRFKRYEPGKVAATLRAACARVSAELM